MITMITLVRPKRAQAQLVSCEICYYKLKLGVFCCLQLIVFLGLFCLNLLAGKLLNYHEDEIVNLMPKGKSQVEDQPG
jgi:hypothetical protein